MNPNTKRDIDIEIERLKKQPIKRVSFIHEYTPFVGVSSQKRKFKVIVEKPQGMVITLYMANLIFTNELNLRNKGNLINAYYGIGRPSYYEQEKIKLVKVINIIEIEPEKQKLFKRFNI